MQAAEGAACEARDSAERAAAAGRLASHAELAKLEETMGQLVTRLLPQGLILGRAFQCARRSAAVAQPVASRPPLKSQTTPATKAGGKAEGRGKKGQGKGAAPPGEAASPPSPPEKLVRDGEGGGKVAKRRGHQKGQTAPAEAAPTVAALAAEAAAAAAAEAAMAAQAATWWDRERGALLAALGESDAALRGVEAQLERAVEAARTAESERAELEEAAVMAARAAAEGAARRESMVGLGAGGEAEERLRRELQQTQGRLDAAEAEVARAHAEAAARRDAGGADTEAVAVAAREARKAAVQEEAVRHLQREAHLRQALLDAQAIFLSPPPLCTLIFASSLYLTTAGSAAAA